jgi:uncharacterized protein YjbI with pentapeptide repeats
MRMATPDGLAGRPRRIGSTAMAPGAQLLAPDLPELEAVEVSELSLDGELAISGLLLQSGAGDAVDVARVQVRESSLEGVTLAAGAVPGMSLSDVVLSDCDLSNLDGREGLLRRVEVRTSRLVGTGFSEAGIQDLRVLDSSMMLASFAAARLRSAVFERVNLSESSFLDARLNDVAFIDCDLRGADFRGARLIDCSISGSSLDGVLGVDSLSGLTMPWPDILDSAAALATALGISIESDD